VEPGWHSHAGAWERGLVSAWRLCRKRQNQQLFLNRFLQRVEFAQQPPKIAIKRKLDGYFLLQSSHEEDAS
jgi:hypothetical protein